MEEACSISQGARAGSAEEAQAPSSGSFYTSSLPWPPGWPQVPIHCSRRPEDGWATLSEEQSMRVG